MSAPPSTPMTLLVRLRRDPRDEKSLTGLFERYGPSIFSWCRRRGLNHQNAEDTTQDILIRIVKGLHTYDVQRSFRGWLYACVQNEISDFLRRLPKNQTPIDVLNPPADDRLEDVLTQMYERELVEVASQMVRLRVSATTWDAWQLTAPRAVFGGEELAPAEAARRLNIRTQTVYEARNRVLEMLREEMERLDADS